MSMITTLPSFGGTSPNHFFINTGTATTATTSGMSFGGSSSTLTIPASQVQMQQGMASQIAEQLDQDMLREIALKTFPRPLQIAQRAKLNVTKYMYEASMPPDSIRQGVVEIPAYRVAEGLQWYKIEENSVLELPDGTIIDIEDQYRWKVYEDNAKVTREACRIQAFNRFLNASEMLEAFIKDCAPVGIKQNQILKVPVEAFINWLIFKAAEHDGDVLPSRKWSHRCGFCQKFIPKQLVAMGVNFCGSKHLDRYLQRNEMKLLEAPV